MREILANETIIELYCESDKRLYKIDRLIGEGASCVAYDAHRIDTENAFPRCRIKECYPAGQGVKRVNGELQWASETIRDAAYERFRNAHNLMVELRDDETLGNNITSAELCKGNGTIYSVMEVNHGGKFSDEINADLWTVIDTLRVLADVVDSLHSKGYLHLDIKPDNFWVCYQPSTMLWLFDVDSMLSLMDLRQGKVTAIPYSKGYAAPEQEQWRLSRLGPASDVYAIGAVLFEKIMKRLPTCWDRGMFAEWDFDGEFFDKVNPQIKRRLKEIFLKTLAAYPGSRYQAASELSDTLRAAEELLKEPYLISDYPVSLHHYVGREEEIELIEQAFSAGEQFVFLQGMGGIGKSELAKQYAKQHAKNYDAIVFVKYTKSIIELLNGLHIQHFNGTNEEKMTLLKRLLDRNTLLIIDGYDNENEDDCGVLERLKCHVLITSRVDREEDGWGKTISLSALRSEQQLELFELEYGNALTDADAEIVERIFAHVEGHTLLIPLLAKQMKKGWFDFKKAEELLTVAGIRGVEKGKIRHQKDGIQLYDSLSKILKKFFETAKLTDDQCEVLRIILLMHPYPIDQAAFLKWMGDNAADTIDELCSQGWIRRDSINGTVYLDIHIVIAEAIREELNPTIRNCPPIKAYIQMLANSCGNRNRVLVNDGFPGKGWLRYRYLTELDYYSNDYCFYLIENILRRESGGGEAKLFWAEVIEKIVSPYMSFTAPLREILLKMWNDSRMDYLDSNLYRARVAFSLAICELNRLDFGLVRKYIRYIADLASDNPEKYMVQFHACFSFYEYLRAQIYSVDLYQYPEFDEAAQCVKELWEKLLATYPYDTLENGVVIATYSGYAPITKIQMQQAYSRFCEKLFVQYLPPAVSLPEVYDFEPVYIKFYSDNEYNDAVTELNQIEAVKDLDTALRYIHHSIWAISSSIPYEKYESPDSLIIRTTSKLTSIQKQVLSTRLQVIDKKDAILLELFGEWERDMLITNLGEMEAMLAYAYAISDNWDAFERHMDRLLDCYKRIMQTYAGGLLSNSNRILNVAGCLPGLLLLMNAYGEVLPHPKTIEIYGKVSNVAERVFAGSKYEKETLFRFYDLGWKLAHQVNDSISMALYSNKFRSVSGTKDVFLRLVREQ